MTARTNHQIKTVIALINLQGGVLKEQITKVSLGLLPHSQSTLLQD